MSISLYSVIVPTYQQILGSVNGLLDKAEEHCKQTGTPAADLIQARFANDMLPFAYQITSCAWHSKGAIDGVRNGLFSPDQTAPPGDFVSLRARLAEAIETVKGVSEDEVNGFVGKTMRFEAGEFKLNFIAEDFLFSFSQPNFYFHATTAYDLLRWKGLDIGKRDFLGMMRLSR